MLDTSGREHQRSSNYKRDRDVSEGGAETPRARHWLMLNMHSLSTCVVWWTGRAGPVAAQEEVGLSSRLGIRSEHEDELGIAESASPACATPA